MSSGMKELTHRDRQIICGLFLSKFDQDGLAHLGFDGFSEAFNTLAYSLNARPASIKNYRDELDPCFPNPRQGWHKRPLRDHCRQIMDAYGYYSMAQLGCIIRGFLTTNPEAEAIPEVREALRTCDPDGTSSFAKRLITGRAAEGYFVGNYREMSEFAGLSLTDATGWGCGFDFKLTNTATEPFLAVEVKGMRARSGQVELTNLEIEMARLLRDRYYLVLVRNFVEQPFHTVIRNPSNSHLKFKRVTRTEVRSSWSTSVGE